MNKVAIIEDDTDLYSLIEHNLGRAGYQVVGSLRGGGTVQLCREERPDVLLLDVMLPDADGFDICRILRSCPDLASLPVVFVTARSSELDVVRGLELGANDYIVKPFSVRELIARVKAQIRTASGSRALKTGGLELDPERCQVRVEGHDVPLTATEFRLLEQLMNRPGVVFSRSNLLDSVWGLDRAVTDRTVDVFVMRLRRKLEAAGVCGEYVQSVRGFGYTFRADAAKPSSGEVAGGRLFAVTGVTCRAS